jgi:hypothetical protein
MKSYIDIFESFDSFESLDSFESFDSFDPIETKEEINSLRSTRLSKKRSDVKNGVGESDGLCRVSDNKTQNHLVNVRGES